MARILLAFVSFFFLFNNAFANTDEPDFVLLPNIKTKYLMSISATKAVAYESEAIEVVKRTLNITPASPYKSVRIRLIYNDENKVSALIVGLLSLEFKSITFVRLDLNNNFTVARVIKDYQLQAEDLQQSPNYAYKYQAHCPDDSVQFVIGNNFRNPSVEYEVQKTFQLAKDKGYNPVLMDIMNPAGPQPTVQAYENWLSCPNLKGFYNESHGWSSGIVLSDDEFLYTNIDRELINKLNHIVVLFDSCLTFHNPLLSAVQEPTRGNVQQYIAGFISLPFGPSERTASCIWTEAFNHQALNERLIQSCSQQNNLQINGYKIAGNGDTHLTPAT